MVIDRGEQSIFFRAAAIPFFVIASGWLLSACAPPARDCPSQIIVNAFEDGNDGACEETEGGCSLREAVILSNSCPGKQKIGLPRGTYRLSLLEPGTNTTETEGISGDLDVTDQVVIVGEAPESVVIDGSNLGERLFDVQEGAATVLFENLILTGGRQEISLGGGAVRVQDNSVAEFDDVIFRDNASFNFGGGLLNTGRVAIRNTEFLNNTAGLQGGALWNRGDAVIIFSRFEGNCSRLFAGAVANNAPARIEIKNTRFLANTASPNLPERCTFPNENPGVGDGSGGAFRNTGEVVVIEEALFFQNRADNGGAVRASDSVVRIQSSVFRENQAESRAGAISSSALFEIEETLFEGNSASGSAGAISSFGTLFVHRSLFRQNQAGQSGGAILNAGVAEVHRSAFLENAGRFGGAIAADNVIHVLNSFLHGNEATESGGALHVDFGGGGPSEQVLNIKNTTLSDNRAPEGASMLVGPFASASMNHSVVTNDPDLPTCAIAGFMLSRGFNAESQNLCQLQPGGETQDLTNQAPQLGLLMESTIKVGMNNDFAFLPFRSPLSQSPLVDTGSTETSDFIGESGCLPADQIGNARPAPGVPRCDRGSIEVGG